MTRLAAPWLSAPSSQSVCGMLTGAGHQALFVGGCVRNALLGVPVADLDIATDARPQRVMDLAGAAGLKALPTGIDHGTVTVMAGGEPFEVTTFRRDVVTDGRHAKVAYSNSAAEDAHRRDFTMNALYATPEGDVIDPLGGLDDLRARRIRFIDDASQRIAEDYLRILRFFRFFAWYGDQAEGLDAGGLAACAALSDGIETLSAERIGAEMLKLLAAPDPAQSVAAMAQSGVLARTLPGAEARGLQVLLHLEGDTAPDPIRRLAALGGQDIAGRLRLSRAEARAVDDLRASAGSSAAPGALGYRLGAERGRDAVLLRAALLEQPLPDGWQDEVATGAAAKFPVSAADLMPALQGPALGERLKSLESRWIASGFALDRAALLASPE